MPTSAVSKKLECQNWNVGNNLVTGLKLGTYEISSPKCYQKWQETTLDHHLNAQNLVISNNWTQYHSFDLQTVVLKIKHFGTFANILSYSELNSIEFTESTEFVDYY